MAIANYFVEYSDLDEIWFIVSPQNPLKKRNTLIPEQNRFDMVDIAVGNDERFRVSDVEFFMPKPSYTIDTLTYLSERNTTKQFCLIMGSDNLVTLHKWKNYEQIISNYSIYVYPRPGFNRDSVNEMDTIKVIEAPMMDISSTMIRNSIKEGRYLNYFLPGKVYDYINKENLYK
jgi:nicotinate-nucleotide adenylyltransferase